MCELKPPLQRGKAGQENSTQKSFLNVKHWLFLIIATENMVIFHKYISLLLTCNGFLIIFNE